MSLSGVVAVCGLAMASVECTEMICAAWHTNNAHPTHLEGYAAQVLTGQLLAQTGSGSCGSCAKLGTARATIATSRKVRMRKAICEGHLEEESNLQRGC